MSVKQSEVSNKNQKIKDIERTIEEILKKEILRDLPEIKENFQNILLQLKNTRFSDSNIKTLEGEVFDAEKIKEIIVEASGYIKWSLDDEEVIKDDDIEWYKNNYSIDFKETEIKSYVFCRSVNSRDQVSIIVVKAFPGLFDVEVHTGRAGYDLNGLVDKKDFIKKLGLEFE